MAQINVSLPDGLKKWVDDQVATGRYSSASDYIREVLRADEERAAQLAWLQTEIDKGRASGKGRDYKEFFAELRAARSIAA
jgi:antitoxin ParD1/3/4